MSQRYTRSTWYCIQYRHAFKTRLLYVRLIIFVVTEVYVICLLPRFSLLRGVQRGYVSHIMFIMLPRMARCVTCVQFDIDVDLVI